jgi:hypothetical protein
LEKLKREEEAQRLNEVELQKREEAQNLTIDHEKRKSKHLTTLNSAFKANNGNILGTARQTSPRSIPPQVRRPGMNGPPGSEVTP